MKKYRILINYDDEDNHATGTRLVEPYVLGYTKAGNLAFRGYQYEGDTVRGVPKWKLFRLDRVINWQPTKQKFNVAGLTQKGYNELEEVVLKAYNECKKLTKERQNVAKTLEEKIICELKELSMKNAKINFSFNEYNEENFAEIFSKRGADKVNILFSANLDS